MSDIIIKKEMNVPKNKWDNFLHHTNSYNLFTCIEYYTLLKAEIYFIVAYDNNDLIIGATICRIRGGIFPFSMLSKSLWIESGLLIKTSNPKQDFELKIKLLQFIEKEARQQKCILIKFNHWCLEENPEIFSINNYEKVYYSTFISDLTLSQDELYLKLDRNNKSAIKKARSGKLSFNMTKKVEVSIINDFYNIYKLTQKRAIKCNKNVSMTLKPLDFIMGILELDKLNCYFADIIIKEKLAAGLILVKSGDTLISYIAASDIEINREYGASTLLFWKSMLWAKDQGIKYFDFGGVPNNPNPGSPAYGVYRFKKNFGGKLTQFIVGQKVLYPTRAKVLNKMMDSRPVVRTLMKLSNKF